MTTVHIILNAHLDPIWLWSWRDGLDEVLNTSYYICNLLDRHPDIVYTRGESWVYEQIRRVDPALFERIRAHVKAGRWSTVGGWYIQPDCNLPSGFAMQRQIEIGRAQFREFFDEFPKVGYNVDSFGHSAAIPGLMRQAGQEFYVMMRPQEHEMELPARLFRWRGYEGSDEVIAFRIAAAYCTPEGLSQEHILASLADLPEGISHTMCFVGVGDHGGGPTEAMIQWCREHRHSIPGAELVFSSPNKFFAAIKDDASRLPEVIGELQMHAVGCYSVHRSVKLAVRKAEHRLLQAELTLKNCSSTTDADRAILDDAWKSVCFHHFHDTLGGTCIPSAYRDVEAQLGAAMAAADKMAAFAFRQRVIQMPEDPAQRIVCLNASERPFADYVEVEPWLEWSSWNPAWGLVDERDSRIPHQVLQPESSPGNQQVRLLFPASVEAGELRTFRIVDSGKEEFAPTIGVKAEGVALTSPDGIAVTLGKAGQMDLGTLKQLPLPGLALYDDMTDTWSHGIRRYPREKKQMPVWESTRVEDKGPLMASLIQKGTIGSSPIYAEWRVCLGKPWVECLMRIHWMEKNRILKFEWEFPGKIGQREDGTMGGSLLRQNDGIERPFRDWVRMPLDSIAPGSCVAVIAPEVFAMDCNETCLGLTLLRGCSMAWHEPHPDTNPRAIISDQGEHFLRYRFLAADKLEGTDLDEIAQAWQRPLLTAELTRGMRNRSMRSNYAPPALTPNNIHNVQ